MVSSAVAATGPSPSLGVRAGEGNGGGSRQQPEPRFCSSSVLGFLQRGLWNRIPQDKWLWGPLPRRHSGGIQEGGGREQSPSEDRSAQPGAGCAGRA